MPAARNLREKRKQESRDRILEAAANSIRSEGLEGASIVPIMKQAGLTHGSFYSHFEDRNALVNAAFKHAVTNSRRLWSKQIKNASNLNERFKHFARSYLNIDHREELEKGCAIGALITDAARSSHEFKETFEQELEKSLQAILNSPHNDETERQQAIAFFAMCIGGISLSRAVNNEEFSEEILNACIEYSDNITKTPEHQNTRTPTKHTRGNE
ncbi:MAG: TetR/AcrR family transcriptional regulator [Agarilytica sp.]